MEGSTSQMLAGAQQQKRHARRNGPRRNMPGTSFSTAGAPHVLMLVCWASCAPRSAAAGACGLSAVVEGTEGGAPWAGAESRFPAAAAGAGDASKPACAGAAAVGSTARGAAGAGAAAVTAGDGDGMGAARLRPLNRSSRSPSPPLRSAELGWGSAPTAAADASGRAPEVGAAGVAAACDRGAACWADE